MKVKFKKTDPTAVIPKTAKPGDAGTDLTAVARKFDADRQYWEYDTGIAVEIPPGYVGLIFPRSSISNKDLILCNHVGVIDSGFRGNITFRFKELENVNGLYEVGDKIGQLIIIPYPSIEYEEVNELSDSERGSSGYGSTGK